MSAEVTERRVWALAFMCLAPMMAIWALTNPLFASPDETAHMVRAQGFARLDFSAPYETDGIPISEVECLRFQPDVTAECMNLTWGPDGTAIDVPVDGYPPLLHAVAAMPATFLSGPVGAYAMRIAMVVVNASLLAWAFSLALAGGIWRLTGLILGITPMAVFTASTVNSTGLIAGGAALFVAAGVRVVSDRDLRRSTLLAVAVGGVLLIGTRRDGLLWLGVLLALGAIRFDVVSPKRIAQGFQQHRLASGAVVLVIIGGAAWGVPGVWRFVEARDSAEGSAWQALRAFRVYLDQLFGVFGWLDSTMGLEAFMLSLVVVGAVVLVALMVGSGREQVALALAVTLLVVIPVVFGALRYPYFQGRYLLPLWIGVMFLAGDAIGSAIRRDDIRSLRVAPLLVIWAVVHMWSIINNLKRYATGRNGTWQLDSTAPWHPPMMSNLLALALIGAAGLAMLWSGRRLLALGPRAE